MRKEQRDFILNKLRSAVSVRMKEVMKDRPTEHTYDDYVSYLESKGIKVKDKYAATRAIELEPDPAHAENKEYYRAVSTRLNAEVSDMETALMLNKDPDAVALLEAALERIKGV